MCWSERRKMSGNKKIYIAEKLKLLRRRQRANDRKLKIFLTVFIIGYLFFFTSQYTFPKVYRNVEVAETGDMMDLGSVSFSFVTWDYSKKQKAFEILLLMENMSMDETPEVTFSCRSGDSVFPTKVEKIIDDSLYVIKVNHVPRRFTIASLNIEYTDSDTLLTENGKFYTDDRHTGEVSAAVTDNEYRIYCTKCEIKGCEKEKRDLIKYRDELDGKLNYSVEKMEALEREKKLQTDSERASTDEKISQMSSENESLQGELNEIMLEIEELDEKMKLQSKKLKILGGGKV